MKRQWLYLGILFLFGTGLVLAACGAKAPSMSLVAAGDSAAVTAPAEEQPAAPYTIALVMKTLTNPFFVEMEKGVR